MEMPLEERTTQQTQGPVRGPHGGWQKQEIEALERSVEQAEQSGEPLRSVFERMGQELGRRPNSIRNFYYAQVRARQEDGSPRALPFETFTQEEVEELMKSVLTARARGVSVRACVRELAGGDRTRMLRYQNKYRSVIRTRPELVRRVMEELDAQGTPYVSPYDEGAGGSGVSMPALREKAARTEDQQVAVLMDALDHLLDLALANREGAGEQTAADAPSAQRRADRLGARCDMLRIALDDEMTRSRRLREETEGMVTLMKEYIALPEQERAANTEAFCARASARLSAVECALMAGEAQ